MTLKETVDQGIKEAMKQHDAIRLRTLRAIKAALLVVETSEGKVGQGLSEQEEIQLLNRQVKQRRDSIEQFKANGRPELAKLEEEELAVIEQFLPKALSSEELEVELKAIVTEVGAKGPADLGKVMKLATQRLAGRADGKVVSEAVKRLLSSSQ